MRELGAGRRDVATYAARFEPPPHVRRSLSDVFEVVILECYPGKGDPSDPAFDDVVRSAEALSGLVHWNIARVRSVAVWGDDLVVVNEGVEGETYATLTDDGRFAEMPFPIRLRVIVDLLGGLSALHGFGEPAGRIHRGVSPENIVVGRDGRTRLVRICNLAEGKVSPASPTLSYVAPELLAADAAAGPAADIYSVGVLLWEALCGKRLSVQTNATGWLVRALDQGPPPGIPADDMEWAIHLVPIVKRALAEISERFENAADMAAAIRLTARAHLATTEEVAEFVETSAGAKITERVNGFAAQRVVGPTFDAVSPAARRASAARIVSATSDEQRNTASPRAVRVGPKVSSITRAARGAEVDSGEIDGGAPLEDAAVRVDRESTRRPRARPIEEEVIVARSPPTLLSAGMIRGPQRKKIAIAAACVAVALVAGYGVGAHRNHPPPAVEAASGVAGAPAGHVPEVPVPEVRAAIPPLDRAAEPSAPASAAPREIELVPEPAAAPARPRARPPRRAPVVAPSEPVAPPEPPPGTERETFNPQGI